MKKNFDQNCSIRHESHKICRDKKTDGKYNIYFQF